MHTCAWISVNNCPYTIENYKDCPYSKHGYAVAIKVPLWCLHRTYPYEHTFTPVQEILSLETHMIDPKDIDATLESPTINLDLPLDSQVSLEYLNNWKPSR